MLQAQQTRSVRGTTQRCARRVAVFGRTARKTVQVFASTQTVTKTVKIGTRGSPLALAQAYLTRDLLKVNAQQPMRPSSMSDVRHPQQQLTWVTWCGAWVHRRTSRS
jgi:hypothetical protein